MEKTNQSPEKTPGNQEMLILQLIDKMAGTQRNLLDAVKGLKDICERQQVEIDKMNKLIDRMREFLPNVE